MRNINPKDLRVRGGVGIQPPMVYFVVLKKFLDNTHLKFIAFCEILVVDAL